MEHGTPCWVDRLLNVEAWSGDAPAVTRDDRKEQVEIELGAEVNNEDREQQEDEINVLLDINEDILSTSRSTSTLDIDLSPSQTDALFPSIPSFPPGMCKENVKPTTSKTMLAAIQRHHKTPKNTQVTVPLTPSYDDTSSFSEERGRRKAKASEASTEAQWTPGVRPRRIVQLRGLRTLRAQSYSLSELVNRYIHVFLPIFPF